MNSIIVLLLLLVAVGLLMWNAWTTSSVYRKNIFWNPEEHAINWFLDIRKGLLALSEEERVALMHRWKCELTTEEEFMHAYATVAKFKQQGDS